MIQICENALKQRRSIYNRLYWSDDEVAVNIEMTHSIALPSFFLSSVLFRGHFVLGKLRTIKPPFLNVFHLSSTHTVHCFMLTVVGSCCTSH